MPRKYLLIIYKSFIRPHLDYADVIYHQPHNESFTNKIESVQYNAALAITGAIKGTSRERLYQELGLESLSDRRRYRQLTLFCYIIKYKPPSYLINYLPSLQFSLNLFNRYRAVTDYFNNSFFPYCVSEWNKLSPEIRNSKCISVFKILLLKFIRPNAYDVYNIHDPIGLKFLTRLRPKSPT